MEISEPSIVVKNKLCNVCRHCEDAASLETRLFSMAKCSIGTTTSFSDLKLILSINNNGGAIKNTHLLTQHISGDKEIRIASMPTRFEDGTLGYRGFEIISPTQIELKRKFSPLQTALNLSQAIQGHDHETHAHDIRVGKLTSLIANLTLGNLKENKDKYEENEDLSSLMILAELERNLKIDYYYKERFEAAGILHDIGKSFISSEILKKPGKLDEEEYTAMKLHALFGFKLLYGIVGLEESALSALFHHEQWSIGKGYYSMKNSLIPLIANIVSAADIIDAMTTPRIYRNPSTFSYEYTKKTISGEEIGDRKGNFVGYWHPVITSVILERWEDIIVPYHQGLFIKFPDN